MAQNEQNLQTLTWEEKKQAYLKNQKKHEMRLQTDPEYKKWWEKQQKDFKKISLLEDNMES